MSATVDYTECPKNGTIFWYALSSSYFLPIFKILSLSESGENLQ